MNNFYNYYISLKVENFDQSTKLCNISLITSSEIVKCDVLYHIDNVNVFKNLCENLKKDENYYFEKFQTNKNNLRFICNKHVKDINSTIFSLIQDNNEKIRNNKLKEKYTLNEKSIQTNYTNVKTNTTQTNTISETLSNELIVLHNDIVPNVPCNTPITINHIQNELNNLNSQTPSTEFHTIDSINLGTPPVEKLVKHTSSSDSSSDSSENENYTTLVNHKRKRRKRPVRSRALCVIDTSSSDSEDETVQHTWNECIMEILDECPKTIQKIGNIMSMRFPSKMTGNTPYDSLNERCQSLVKDGRAQRMKSEFAGNNIFKYFV